MYIVALVYLTRVLLLCLFINFTEIFGDGFLSSQVTYWIFCTVDKRRRNHVYLRHILNMYDLYFANHTCLTRNLIIKMVFGTMLDISAYKVAAKLRVN